MRPHEFLLINPEIRISEASQTRARGNKQRNVHAYIVGDDFELNPKPFAPDGILSYNPFKNDTFVDANFRTPIEEITGAYFRGDTAFYSK